MRYFLPTIPLWEVLSVGVLIFGYRQIRKFSPQAAIAFVIVLVGWSLLRSGWLVWKIAIPNDAFYF